MKYANYMLCTLHVLNRTGYFRVSTDIPTLGAAMPFRDPFDIVDQALFCHSNIISRSIIRPAPVARTSFSEELSFQEHFLSTYFSYLGLRNHILARLASSSSCFHYLLKSSRHP